MMLKQVAIVDQNYEYVALTKQGNPGGAATRVSKV